MPKLLALLKMKKGEVKTISCRGMIENDRNGKIEKMFTYLARNLLYSNVNFVDNGKKRKIKDGVIKNIIKPSCVIDYNKGMGVDKQDQLLSCFPLMRRCNGRQRKTTPKINRRIHHLSKKDRITYNLLLQQYNTGAFFDRLITGAEKWVHIFQTIIVGITETGLNKSAHESEKDTSGWALNSPFATLYEKIIHVR
ncbi:hypothetical protein HZH66_014663 [Vespula vulgaris]|uniref:Uncharacterized protein n=1 Tax=Vespula vulgaris TaxID=7454 RepID=A0A834J164_VESVU|nr:hypothetical protein HZH66_014663 [Vespula vulgaris]